MVKEELLRLLEEELDTKRNVVIPKQQLKQLISYVKDGVKYTTDVEKVHFHLALNRLRRLSNIIKHYEEWNTKTQN